MTELWGAGVNYVQQDKWSCFLVVQNEDLNEIILSKGVIGFTRQTEV